MKGTLRERYRYIVVKLTPSQEVDKFEFEKRLQKALLNKLGEIDYSLAMPRVLFYTRSSAILRTRRDGIDKALLGLTLLSKFGTEQIHVQTVFTSGTILGCKNKLKKR